MSCQLTEIQDLLRPRGLGRKISRARVELLRPIKNKILGLIRGITTSPRMGSGNDSASIPTGQEIHPGDLVRVRPRREIKRLLDRHGKYRGCTFTHEMYTYCDRKFRVHKNIETFFDETKQKMCRCRNTVILDGAVCSGRQRLYAERCDRNCFFFWQTDWLEKVE